MGQLSWRCGDWSDSLGSKQTGLWLWTLGYSNPYYGGSYDTSCYGYRYSEPHVSNADSGTATATPSDPGAGPVESAAAGAPATTDEGMAALESARTAFYEGEYEKALTLLDTTLKTMPNDTVVHEFRGLVLFALKEYPKSAAAIYAVLSAGPGCDWTTMSGLYPAGETYTKQWRNLRTLLSRIPSLLMLTSCLGITIRRPATKSKHRSILRLLWNYFRGTNF